MFRPELEAALVRELLQEWRTLNHGQFRDALRAPRIELFEGESRLGEWRLGTRTLAIGRTFAFSRSWGEVREVLKHEMAHQYAHEVLGAVDETAHGPAFREVCARLGIDAAAAGVPVAGDGENKVVRRITKLLALAESPNPHEAQAAMNAARRLMLEYNLGAAPSGYGFRHLGDPSGRILEQDRILAGILGDHFFVEAIWVPVYDPWTARHGRVLEICGSPENLELAAYVFGFLRETAARLFARQRLPGRERPRFVSGVMRGFADKLAEGARQCKEEGLVWVGDPALGGFLKKRYPRIKHVRYGGGARNDAWEEGRAAGREIVLHKPVVSRGAGGERKLLG